MLSSPSSASTTVQGRHFLLHSRSKWGLRPLPCGIAITNRTKGQAFRLLANPNVSSGRENPINDVVMVDPLEAKRLAAKQMQQLKAKDKFQVSEIVNCNANAGDYNKYPSLLPEEKEIEAINGAWAMIGLTAGLVIEGQTGKSILGQLGGYLEAVFSYFLR